jgi:hypothetical protein
MFCGSGHLGFSIGIKNKKFVEDLPMIKLYMNVHWMVLYNLKVVCSDMKFKMAATAGGHLGFLIDIKNIHFVEDLPITIPGQFGFNCHSGFREEAF